jgi:nitronate monooxygenase
MGQFCIDQQLGHAMTGETDKGLYFRGAGLLPFGQEIRSVEDLMQYLITGRQPAPLTLEEASA